MKQARLQKLVVKHVNTELTQKEHKLLRLVCEGHSNKEIGKLLSTTESAIKNRVRRIYDKIGMFSRLEAALWYEHKHGKYPVPQPLEKELR